MIEIPHLILSAHVGSDIESNWAVYENLGLRPSISMPLQAPVAKLRISSDDHAFTGVSLELPEPRTLMSKGCAMSLGEGKQACCGGHLGTSSTR